MKTVSIELPDELIAEFESLTRSGARRDDVIQSALRKFLEDQRRRILTQQHEHGRHEDSGKEDYQRRAELLEQAWQKTADNNSAPALTLDALVAAMKESSRSEKPSSCIYFAGSDVDHPYFLKSDALAVGLAVLPEDAEKAKVRKRHPHQVEVMFVLNGVLRLHIEENAPVVLQKGDHYVIGKNVCHWITLVENQPGVFVFVKTNPAEEPRGVSCGDSVERD